MGSGRSEAATRRPAVPTVIARYQTFRYEPMSRTGIQKIFSACGANALAESTPIASSERPPPRSQNGTAIMT